MKIASIFVCVLTVAASSLAEDKLVPRNPFDALDQIREMKQNAMAESMMGSQSAAPAPKPAFSAPLTPVASPLPPPPPATQARIVYIHRRATLPPALTADLSKTASAKAPAPTADSTLVPRQGKLRIIPKDAVGALTEALAKAAKTEESEQ